MAVEQDFHYYMTIFEVKSYFLHWANKISGGPFLAEDCLLLNSLGRPFRA